MDTDFLLGLCTIESSPTFDLGQTGAQNSFYTSTPNNSPDSDIHVRMYSQEDLTDVGLTKFSLNSFIEKRDEPQQQQASQINASSKVSHFPSPYYRGTMSNPNILLGSHCSTPEQSVFHGGSFIMTNSLEKVNRRMLQDKCKLMNPLSALHQNAPNVFRKDILTDLTQPSTSFCITEQEASLNQTTVMGKRNSLSLLNQTLSSSDSSQCGPSICHSFLSSEMSTPSKNIFFPVSSNIPYLTLSPVGPNLCPFAFSPEVLTPDQHILRKESHTLQTPNSQQRPGKACFEDNMQWRGKNSRIFKDFSTPMKSCNRERSPLRSYISGKCSSLIKHMPFKATCRTNIKKYQARTKHKIKKLKKLIDPVAKQEWTQSKSLYGRKRALSLKVIKTKYEVGFIDTHCHIDFLFNKLGFWKSFEAFIDECEDSIDAFPKSFEGCVSVFCNPETFEKTDWWTSILSTKNVWGTFGCHPHFVDRFGPAEEEHLRSALKHYKVKAAGEMGLDYSGRNNNSAALQKEIFLKQLVMAVEAQKPIVIHCRDAFEDCFAILTKILPKDYVIHIHCFKGNMIEAKLYLEHFPNLYLGFTCFIAQTMPKAEKSRHVVRSVPLKRILLETDAPYFRPFFLRNGKSSYSHPGMAIHVAAAIAEIRNIPIEIVLEETRNNTRRVYDI